MRKCAGGGGEAVSKQAEFSYSSAARVMRDSRRCAGAVRVQSAVSAGAGAPCVRIPVTYAYSPPRTAKGGMACLPRWLARTLGWARRGRTADLATWTSVAFDSMSVLFAADRLHVSVPMLGHAAKIWRSIAAAA